MRHALLVCLIFVGYVLVGAVVMHALGIAINSASGFVVGLAAGLAGLATYLGLIRKIGGRR